MSIVHRSRGEYTAAMSALQHTGMLFGTFDGLHIGHAFLIEHAKCKMQNWYGATSKLCIVVGRDSTVAHVKGKKPRQNERVRVKALKSLFPECRVVLGHKTNRMFWLRKVRPCAVFLGYDQRAFVDVLRRELKSSQLPTKIVRIKPFHEGVYKSSALKKPQLLIRGEVVHGKKLARSVGYPTANIHLSKHMRESVARNRISGVYASRVLLDGRAYIGATVVGARAHSGAPLVETHVIGYSGDCYGKILVISLEKKLRQVKKYTTEKSLVGDIKKDIQQVGHFFS